MALDDEAPKMQLSQQQAKAVVGLERAGASLSMIGVLLILITFAFSKRLRTVPNTFILFASIANIGASTASLIGLSGIALGTESSLCRAQAFLLEMFMQSDPWWSFAMAFNVYLVFFHSANPTTFRRHLWVYCLVCFGLPMVPAIVCLYVQSTEKGPAYGDATLWCWIGDRWNSLRIFSYYIPIWVCIFFSAVIYIAVGYHVFHQRNQLRNLTLSNQAKEASSSEPGCYGTVTTEVQITSDACDTMLSSATTATATATVTAAGAGKDIKDGDSQSSNKPDQGRETPTTPPPWSDGLFPNIPANTQVLLHHQHHFHDEALIADKFNVDFPTLLPLPVFHGASGSTNPFQAMPSTVRVYAEEVPHEVVENPGSRARTISVSVTAPAKDPEMGCPERPLPFWSRLNFGHGITIRLRMRLLLQQIAVWPRRSARRLWQRCAGKLRHMDPVKLAYLRTSFVFAISVLVTWTPSSINRVYTLVYPARNSYGLNMASAAVLPLQGVWNAVIYFTTSWSLLREEWRCLTQRSTRLRRWLKVQDGGGGAVSGVGGGRGDGRAGGVPDLASSTRSQQWQHQRWGDSVPNGPNRLDDDEYDIDDGIAGMDSDDMEMIADSGGGGRGGGASAGKDSIPGTPRSAGEVSRSRSNSGSGPSSGTGGCYTHPELFDNDSIRCGSGSLSGGRRQQQSPSTELELSPRSPIWLGTVRVQRGGDLDI